VDGQFLQSITTNSSHIHSPKNNTRFYKLQKAIKSKYPFLHYEAEYLLNHANIAQQYTSQRQFLEEQFPLSRWQAVYNSFHNEEDGFPEAEPVSLSAVLAVQTAIDNGAAISDMVDWRGTPLHIAAHMVMQTLWTTC